MIFKGATAGLKLVGDSFPWTAASRFVYLRESAHTSLVGIRQMAIDKGASFSTVSLPAAQRWLNRPKTLPAQLHSTQGHSLFAMPAQCNFSGQKFIDQSQRLCDALHSTVEAKWYAEGSSEEGQSAMKWYFLLDAASFVSTSPLDLTKVKADFTCVSFYKIFGFPTGIGCLIVRNGTNPKFIFFLNFKFISNFYRQISPLYFRNLILEEEQLLLH